MRARARSPHEIPDRPPLLLSAGDTVVVGERDTKWPAFVFVRTDHGDGWVPARHLAADAGTTVVETPYDTSELPVAVGDVVTVIQRDDESGWWWCGDADGREGWVPVEVFEPQD